MPEQNRRGNRGPAVAAENRERLIAAARQVFASEGYHVPRSKIARAAGVGQAVLYRHFPTRVSLALAVFSQNLDELEALAAEHADADDCFLIIWRRMVEFTVASRAFVDALKDSRETGEWDASARLTALLEAPLARARRAGLVTQQLSVHDVTLLVRAVYGIAGISSAPDLDADVDRFLTLVDPALAAPGR